MEGGKLDTGGLRGVPQVPPPQAKENPAMNGGKGKEILFWGKNFVKEIPLDLVGDVTVAGLLIIVPEASHSSLGDGRTAVAGCKEVIKEGELVWTQDVGIRLGLDAVPEFGNGSI